MSRTHAQHLKRLAEKRRRYVLLCKHFGGIVMSQRLHDYLLRNIDRIAGLYSDGRTP